MFWYFLWKAPLFLQRTKSVFNVCPNEITHSLTLDIPSLTHWSQLGWKPCFPPLLLSPVINHRSCINRSNNDLLWNLRPWKELLIWVCCLQVLTSLGQMCLVSPSSAVCSLPLAKSDQCSCREWYFWPEDPEIGKGSGFLCLLAVMLSGQMSGEATLSLPTCPSC